MNRISWFVFAGGGTGGHLYPALAVVESLRVRGVPVDVSFFCTDRPVDRDILGAARIEALPQSVRPLPKRPWGWPSFLLAWRASVSVCLRAFRERRPAVVVGAGGYASGPPVHAAMRLGIPTFLLNPDAVPGRANQVMARRQALTGIFAQWEVTRGHLPPKAPVQVTGCPVRAAFREAIRADRSEILRSFGLEADRRTLLITGASLGARTINEAFALLADQVKTSGWQVLHLSGTADRDRVAQAYSSAGTSSVVIAFTERMGQAMAACDLIVSRAGASTLAEIQAAGKPSILLPYPYHKDRHQWHNGRVLVDAGAAIMIDDARDAALNAQQIGPLLDSLMRDDARRQAMARAALSLDRSAAAADIADALCMAGGLGADAPCRSPQSHAQGAGLGKIVQTC